MTAVAAPLRRVARPPDHKGRPSRGLEVVERRRASKRVGGLRRRRLLACSVAAVAVACVLGLVVSHVSLAQGQFELEKLQEKAAAEQARYEQLRLQVARLESPSRVVATAQERLGMVAPPNVTYLSPTGPAPGPPAASSKGREAESATDDWASVKRQLARR